MPSNMLKRIRWTLKLTTDTQPRMVNAELAHTQESSTLEAMPMLEEIPSPNSLLIPTPELSLLPLKLISQFSNTTKAEFSTLLPVVKSLTMV